MPRPTNPGTATTANTRLWEQLRAKHPRFFYERFVCAPRNGSLAIHLHFRIEPDIEFAPETVIEVADPAWLERACQPGFENLVFHLGLIEMLSYWKAACSPEIVVRAGSLNPEQVIWWLDLIRHGMGEFFYVNQIDFRAPDFVRIVPGGGEKQKSQVQVPRGGRNAAARDDSARIRAATARERSANDNARDLVLASGGKDTVVTLELLRAAGRPFDCLLLNPTEAARAVAREAGCDSPIIVRRTIDPRLLEMNSAGYLNGHTPFSALLAFLGVIVASLAGHTRVIVSNERSAEEAGTAYLGEPINHQYSKTLRFETAFREYCRRYLIPPLTDSPQLVRAATVRERGRPRLLTRAARTQNDSEAVEYFSLLRPLYELQIARLFAQHPAYFPLFRSCNRGMKSNAWCGRCPKCLFVYTALYPFVEREQMLAIFGADLFLWEGAAEILRALLGLDRDKPFECVGTREETLAAIYLCVEKYKQQGIPPPASLREIEETVLATRGDLPELVRSILPAWTDQHFLPPDLAVCVCQRITV